MIKSLIKIFLGVIIAVEAVVISGQVIQGNTSQVFLDQAIDSKVKLTTRTLRSAQWYETIYVYMSTPGGEVITGWDLMNAIHNSKAKVILIVDNYSASMGAFIVCGMPHKNLQLKDDAILLYHTMQIVNPLTRQQTPVTKDSVKTLDPFTQLLWYRAYNFTEQNCRKAFTDKEWSDMWEKGIDISMNGKTYKQRMGIK